MVYGPIVNKPVYEIIETHNGNKINLHLSNK